MTALEQSFCSHNNFLIHVEHFIGHLLCTYITVSGSAYSAGAKSQKRPRNWIS